MADRAEAAALVELVVEEPAWLAAVPDLDAVAERAARLALTGAGVAGAGREIALLACSDTRIAALNAAFRATDAPTNVLSWPAHPLAPAAPGAAPPVPPLGPLGDLALAFGTCEREARAASLSLKDHALHLILHGCLHLVGYDHGAEADAAVMEGIESRALVSIGLRDPYEGGAVGPTRRT